MEQADRIIRALSSPVRREILWHVWDAELNAGAIAARFSLRAPTISSHLAVLRDAGLVAMRPEGTTRWYRARREVIAGLRALLGESPDKWNALTHFEEQQLAAGVVRSVVVVTAEAACSDRDAFRGWNDDRLYDAWLGAPVTLSDGHFRAEMDFGTVVRGTYELVCEPSLIVMRWDFRDDAIPAPGSAQMATLVISPVGGHRCHLEIHQFVEDERQAQYMEFAWRYVIGRFVTFGPAVVALAEEAPQASPLGPAQGGRSGVRAKRGSRRPAE